MGNTNDLKRLTDLWYVIDAFRAERYYQLRRWGYRQPNGSFTEATHSIADFVVYMQDYYVEARHKVSREAGNDTSLEVLRKIVCLGIACLEQLDRKDNDQPYTFNDLADCIHCIGRIVPLTLNPDYSLYLLKIKFFLDNAEKQAACFNRGALLDIRELVQVGVECFSQYGIQKRDLSQPIINGRDGLPA